MEFDEDSFPFQHIRPSGDPDWIHLVAIDKGQFYMASFTQDCPPSISSQSDNVGAIVGGVIGSIAFIALVLGIGFFFFWRHKKQSREKFFVETEMTLDANEKWLVNFEEIEFVRDIGKGLRFLERLTIGSFSVAYLAKWRNADCVVKQLKVDDPLAIQDFHREVNILQ